MCACSSEAAQQRGACVGDRGGRGGKREKTVAAGIACATAGASCVGERASLVCNQSRWGRPNCFLASAAAEIRFHRRPQRGGNAAAARLPVAHHFRLLADFCADEAAADYGGGWFAHCVQVFVWALLRCGRCEQTSTRCMRCRRACAKHTGANDFKIA